MKRKRSVLDLLDMDLKSPVANDCMPWVVIYLLAACLAFGLYSKTIGILLFSNAAVALVVGMITRGMGKQDAPVVLLGLLLGPLGGLAGMIAARPVEK